MLLYVQSSKFVGEMGNHEEFFEYLNEIQEEVDRQRMPKRYVRDAENPMNYYTEEQFRMRYRFSKTTVLQTILPLIENQITKVNNRGLPFSPLVQLLVCLRFYATGNFQTVSGDLRGISQQSVSAIIKRISVLLAEKVGQYIKFPVENGQRENATKFFRVAGFPGVVGCLDCTHIPIANPGGENGEVFRNRKGYFSLNVQVVSGPDMDIMDIVVRYPGSTHDSVIFDRSALRVRFEEHHVQGHLIGDNGYPCRPYLLTPVIHPAHQRDERYNAAHRHTRNVVERLFGVWKRKFPCLHRTLSTKLETTVAIICATAVLYNISREGAELDAAPIEENGDNIHNAENNQLGLLFRRQFINQYF